MRGKLPQSLQTLLLVLVRHGFAHNGCMVCANRSLAALLICACSFPLLALADSKQSATYEMQWEDDANKHQLRSREAVTGHRGGRVQVEVFSSKKVIVTDAGKRSEQVYQDGSVLHAESTEWTHVWTGTWSSSGDTMQLDLTLYDRKCVQKETWRGEATKTLPCKELQKKLQLACTAEDVPLDLADEQTPQKGRTSKAWSCRGQDADGISSTWLLGRESCLKSIKTLAGTRHGKCDGARP